jgi:hypothetical protein
MGYLKTSTQVHIHAIATPEKLKTGVMETVPGYGKSRYGLDPYGDPAMAHRVVVVTAMVKTYPTPTPLFGTKYSVINYRSTISISTSNVSHGVELTTSSFTYVPKPLTILGRTTRLNFITDYSQAAASTESSLVVTSTYSVPNVTITNAESVLMSSGGYGIDGYGGTTPYGSVYTRITYEY